MVLVLALLTALVTAPRWGLNVRRVHACMHALADACVGMDDLELPTSWWAITM